MFNWFKKRDDKRLDDLEVSIKNSFQNMKSDMSHVSKWITHFKEKHENHHTKIDELNKRLKLLESLINHEPQICLENSKVRVNETKDLLKEDDEEYESENNLEFSPKKDLTIPLSEKQSHVFLALCGLILESPSKWISIKTLADEAYREFGGHEKNRSIVSQFITLFEINGLIERKRVGKETYVTVIRLLDGKKFDPYSISQKKKNKLITK